MDDELNVEDSDTTGRTRTLSARGMSYELDNISHQFTSLKKITEYALELISTHASDEVVRTKYSLWMQLFESFIEKHHELMARLPNEEKDKYIQQFEDWDAYLQNFKRTIEKYFSTKKATRSASNRSHSSRHSEANSQNTVLSNISARKMAEETRKAELEAQREALQKKRQIELAKVQLKIEEEDLQLKTDIAVADAKTKVLDKYEQLESDKSGSISTASSVSIRNQKDKPIVKNTHVVQLNPAAQSFEPKTTNFDDKVFHSTPKQSFHSKQQQNIPAIGFDKCDTDIGKVDKQLNANISDTFFVNSNKDHNNNTDAVSAIVKNLRKPIPDIKKFGGDPLEFRKFIRQFKAKIMANCDSDDEKMNYLEQFTYGEAGRVVQGFSHLDSEHAFNSAMKQLEERYGDNEVIANTFIKKALDWPVIKSGDSKALDQFALFLIECKNAANSIHAIQILEYSENIKQLMCKLPYHLHDRWRSIVLRTKTNKQTIKFEHFVKFVEDEAKKINDLTYGSSAIGMKTKSDTNRNFNQRKGVRQGSACATNLNTPTSNSQVECSYCKRQHKLETCESIKKLEHQEKLNHLKTLALCFGCLKKGHMTKKCTNRLSCSVCKRKHPTILHYESKTENKLSSDNPSSSTESQGTGSTSGVVSQIGAGDFKSSCAMAIVPVRVKLRDKLKTIDTYAFFDTGSSVSFCTESLMRQLGGSGKYKQITLNTMGSPLKMNTCLLDGLQVSDMDMNHIIDLPTVYTKDEMPVTNAHIPINDELLKWPHLNGIRLPDIDSTVGLMIGNNVPDAYTPFEVATGQPGSPHATKTRLGWIIWNLVRQDIPESYTVVNRAQLTAISNIEENSKLEQLVRHSMNYDFPERLIDDKRENSIEDNCFLEQVNESIHFKNGHYCIALPFKDKNMKFPNNETQGLQRLKGIRSKMIKNQKFKDDYVTFMNNLIAKGHAELVPESELNQNDGRVWYIPHHGVYHPMKPNKIRIVFDCSATYMGVSLNRALLQGPDLANNLLGVLIRFRSEKVPLLGDIEKMFYQVNVPINDRNFLRFLWWPNGNFEMKPKVYRMTVHLFGATSSPSVCNFALRRTAEEHGDRFEKQVSETIQRNMYVDDCLASEETDDKAISLVENVRTLCKEGGFNLTKWVSSSLKVVSSIPEKDRAKEVKQYDLNSETSIERALGVFWYIDTDTLGFQINQKSQPMTKRGILSTVSSVYDPIGIASPFVLLGRTILQNVCKQEIGWDDEIQESDQKKWRNWLYQLSDLSNVKIDRCYKPLDFGKVVSIQLHCFSDASNTGLGMVFYLRLVDETNRIHCSFVLGKARVAPLKTITVPRMELTAASKTVHLSRVILEELSYSIDKVFFWTDSMTVLCYIFNRNTRFHTFVANRLALIHESTDNEQWNYVNTKLNPADLASRGMTVAKFEQCPQWFRGPDFLWLQENDWPKWTGNLAIQEQDMEVKHITNAASIENTFQHDGVQKLLSRVSDIDKMRRIVAWVLRAVQTLRSRIQNRQENDNEGNRNQKNRLNKSKNLGDLRLNLEDVQKGQNALIYFVQHQHFEDEFLKLKSDFPVKRSSRLHKLDPFVDEHGILRVGGRLRRSDLPDGIKHPIILPKDSEMSHLIIRDTHRKIGHLGKNSILTRLREKYWIIGANSIIKSIVSKCVVCRKYQSPIIQQKMADLPSDRVTPDMSPFTAVGIDYFGPFEIKQKRCSLKRYGVIFTCLKMRAIHLEIANSLDTDSCINAIRRFISRRGKPSIIRSDNGTNLVGAQRELKEEIDKWNQDQINSFMLQQNIDWKFNPPAASNFGGVWERLIRSVRKVLYSIMKEQNVRLDDENLHTLFCEVEAILNGRPITAVSEDVNDMKVLTPNDLLLLRNVNSLPPGTFVKTDNYVKRRWRQVQYLADLFWSRWTREYLPLLQSRSKWNKPERNLKIGDLVLIVDNTPRHSWTVGRIQEVIMDNLGVVRIAKVKTATTVLKRSVSKLCLILESDIDN